VLAQSDESWKVYDDTGVARVDITVNPVSLQWMYANVESDSEHVAQIRFRNKWFDETLDSIGFRLRGGTSRQAFKKSFKVSFNSFTKGRRFHGVKKLNLNGEHNDPSIIRSKLSFDLYHDVGVIAPRASHTRVYINGAYYGLYISVENVDEELLSRNYGDDTGILWKCLYPADLHYISDDPAVYEGLKNGAALVYELETNAKGEDFVPLARFIRMLSKTPPAAMADSLESLLDVPTVLKYFAMDVLVGQWDEYRSLMNNYYLYYMRIENRFTLIPYDYDNTFGVDWFSINWSTANPYNYPKVQAGVRPLSEVLLAQNTYRDLFTHFLSYYNTNVLALPRWESRIDRIRDTITSAALQDSMRMLDYHFTAADFINSYTSGSYSNQHVKFGLKQFVNLRNSSLPTQLAFTNAPPTAYNIAVTPENPRGEDSIVVTAACFGSMGVQRVTLLYTAVGSDSVRRFPMVNIPINGTPVVEKADRWIVTLPPLGAGARGSFTLELQDNIAQVQISPHLAAIPIRTQTQSGTGLVINELLADNTNVIADQNGEYDDWIELYNVGSSAIALTGKYLTDNPTARSKWRFAQPNLSINPGEFLLVWCDDQTTQAGIHTNFKLSANGEYAAIVDTDGVSVIDSISFGPQAKNISFGRSPDGGAQWRTMTPSPGRANAVTGVGTVSVIPSAFALTAFPNPFNPATQIRYALPQRGYVHLAVYNILGENVSTLVDGNADAGIHDVVWDGSNRASGVYICRLQTGSGGMSARLLLLK